FGTQFTGFMRMSAMNVSSSSPRPSGSSDPRSSTGNAIASVGRFFLRLGAAYAALFLVWLLSQSWLVRLLTIGADTVLSLVERPPVITALSSRGNLVTAQSYLRGPNLPLASWNGFVLHFFAISPIALVMAVPLGSWVQRARRAALTIIPLSFGMLAVLV